MRLLLLLLVFLVSISNNLEAKIDFRDSSEVYNYWAKRGIIEMIYAYMLDLNSPDEKDKEGQHRFKEEFIDKIDEKSLIQIDADFEKLNVFLVSNHWKNTAENVLKPLNKNFKSFHQIDSVFFEIGGTGKNYREIGIKSKEKQNIIINSYLLELSKIKDASKKKTHNNEVLSESPAKKTQRIEHKKNNNIIQKGIAYYLIIFLFGILIGCVLIYYVFKKQIYNILKHEKKDYMKNIKTSKKRFFPKWLGIVEILKKSKDEYKNDKNKISDQKEKDAIINDLKGKIQKLELENQNLNKRLSQAKEDSNEISNNNAIKNQVDTLKQNIYFSIPENSGQFRLENGKKSNEGNNFYRIEYQEDKTSGLLYFISGELDKRAIERIQGYLLPVCDIENFTDRITASRIQVLEPGRVVLKNDSWVIEPEKKVKIKLL